MRTLSVQVVTIPLEQLADLLDKAVAKAMAAHRESEGAKQQIVSLDRAAKILRRRRADVLAMVLDGRIPAEKAGTARRPIWRVRTGDLERVAR